MEYLDRGSENFRSTEGKWASVPVDIHSPGSFREHQTVGEEIQLVSGPEFLRLITSVLPNMQVPAVESDKSIFSSYFKTRNET